MHKTTRGLRNRNPGNIRHNATRYLGDLSITFDAAGTPVSWTGGPRELLPAPPSPACR